MREGKKYEGGMNNFVHARSITQHKHLNTEMRTAMDAWSAFMMSEHPGTKTQRNVHRFVYSKHDISKQLFPFAQKKKHDRKKIQNASWINYAWQLLRTDYSPFTYFHTSPLTCIPYSSAIFQVLLPWYTNIHQDKGTKRRLLNYSLHLLRTSYSSYIYKFLYLIHHYCSSQ